MYDFGIELRLGLNFNSPPLCSLPQPLRRPVLFVLVTAAAIALIHIACFIVWGQARYWGLD